MQGDADLANLEKSLVSVYSTALQFLSTAVSLFEKQSAARALHAILHPDQVEGFLNACATEEHALESDAANCDRIHQHRFQSVQATPLQSLLAELRAPLVRMDAGVAALFDMSSQAEVCAILQWVSSVPYESNHSAAKAGRTDGTAEWILRHPTFCQRRQSSASMMLWLHGIRTWRAGSPALPPSRCNVYPVNAVSCALTSPVAGAGQTKVVSRVVDHMRKALLEQRSDEGFAYFYFNRSDDARSTASAALCSLVRQLSVTADGKGMQQVLVEMYRSKRQLGFAAKQLHEDDAQHLLRQFVNGYPHTTLVLDALDECDEQTRMLIVDTLDHVVSHAAKPIKVFISSRLDADIAERLESGPNVAVTATDNADDIAKFVDAKLTRRPQWSQKLSSAVRSEIVQTLCAKSGGM